MFVCGQPGDVSVKTLHLSARQRRQLENQLRNTRDARLYRRTLAILEYDRGRAVTEIATEVGELRPSCCRRLVTEVVT